jgi:serine phosphatase RsbU (regulator of sigma subunit)
MGSLLVVVFGVVVTVALAFGAALSYRHSQRRLTTLQTRLTAAALNAAPIDFERRLGQVAGVVANSADPTSAFRRLIASSMKPSGPFAAASLIQVTAGRPAFRVHVGTAPIRKVNGPVATALYLRAAKSHALVTSRAVGHGIQKLGYLMSATGSSGTFIVSGAQSLPLREILPVAPNSPDSGLDIAIYFGTTTNPSALIATTSTHVPSGGETSKAVVPFGTNKLTVVASPRTALPGSLAAALPWAVIAAGLAMTILVALLVERLIRRERHADDLAKQNALLYRQQREVALTLQRALLPRDFPATDGVECAGAYLPGASGAEVGGDWYSVVRTDDKRIYFVVGDISGRGVEAAAFMAQLRFTIRTLASLGHDPADILEHASSDLDFESSDRFATVLVGLIEDKQKLTVASAGHFPPLLIDDERTEYVTVKAGIPLGVMPSRYEAVTVPLAPGTTLIAFTDGLVETRSAGLDEGLERLRSAASTHIGLEVDDLAKSITDQLIPAGSDDDVALLVIRTSPSSVDEPMADPMKDAGMTEAALTQSDR